METSTETMAYLNEDKYNIKRNTSHMLVYGKILFKRSNIIEKIQNIAQKNLTLKTKYTKEEILMHKYSIDDFWGEMQRDFKNNDCMAFDLNSHLLMKNIIEMFIKIKGEYLKQPKEMAYAISDMDKKLGVYMKEFYNTGNMQDKLLIVPKILNHIYKLSGGKLPQKWQIK
ncbi:MAG: hypothetical protein AUJ23_02530 [Candidatus Magasanikbacteria bacterium CG1_02_32_51]|uniref:Uncharacterized protein n=2 Tax=Candidatus Magasanikiibacteriota TaxID=1752731 RepID=A0A1J4U8T1_9BACT|nr:MAG: hypothetical protein AUJ23_02530 [Candidatus Magasanikbacteria bacterium CG1_02_32_51]